MKETLALKKPIKINGKNVKEFTYDPDELTCEQYLDAARRASIPGVIDIQEGDYTLHFYIGCELIVASNPEIDIVDLEQVKGRDVIRLVNIGRNFILSAEAESAEETLDEPSDSTAGSSTPVKPTSESKGSLTS